MREGLEVVVVEEASGEAVVGVEAEVMEIGTEEEAAEIGMEEEAAAAEIGMEEEGAEIGMEEEAAAEDMEEVEMIVAMEEDVTEMVVVVVEVAGGVTQGWTVSLIYDPS